MGWGSDRVDLACLARILALTDSVQARREHARYPSCPAIQALEQRRDSILAALATLGDMRPGSLVHRFLKCSTQSCRCHDKDDPGHGPYSLLVRQVNGKRTSRSVPAASIDTVQAQADNFPHFRSLTAELVAGVVCHIDSLRCCGFESDSTVANR